MKNKSTRRDFLQKSALTAGMAALGTAGMAADNTRAKSDARSQKLPREVWIGVVSQMGLRTDTPEKMVNTVLDLMAELTPYNPDIICLPEVFATSNINQRLSMEEAVEASQSALYEVSAFSKTHGCYTVCPVYTVADGNVYNSAVFIDRQGKNMGEYHKIYLTEDEIGAGIVPGALAPPVFQTDFGKVGAQVCFDLLWDDSWKRLKSQGAEIVFVPSAFAGGKMVNTKAWQHQYVVVSSTRKDTSKICDVTGEEIDKTGIWRRNICCAPVNLEKVFLHAWPYVRRFPEIRQKYGRDVRITIYHEEEWAIIESLSPDIRVQDILEEFELRTHEQHTKDATAAQEKARV